MLHPVRVVIIFSVNKANEQVVSYVCCQKPLLGIVPDYRS